MLDKELESRQLLDLDQTAEMEAVVPVAMLSGRRELAAAEEKAASLDLLRIQSFMVQAEVRRQRVLQQIAAIPYGFTRCASLGESFQIEWLTDLNSQASRRTLNFSFYAVSTTASDLV